MKAQTYLQIPTPCHEDWDKMSPNQQGRHCESCCKTVIDFQMMTDQQILNFFATANDKTCGRFSDDQLNRALIETTIQKKKGWQWFVASIVSFFFITNKATAQGKVKWVGKPSVIVKQPSQASTSKSGDTRLINTKQCSTSNELQGWAQPMKVGEVKSASVLTNTFPKVDTVVARKVPQLLGSVTDENGHPIANVIVFAKTINGSIYSNTNDAGEYYFNNPLQQNEEIELSFSSMGYESKIVPITFDESKLELHVQLKSKPNQLNEVVVVSYQTIKGKVSIGGGVSRVTVKKPSKVDTVSATIKKVFKAEGFKIFPNPASKGKAVNLTIHEAGEYSIQLLDNESRLLHVENANISNKQEIKLFNIPSTISSGTHYIRLVNEKTKKQFVDKIVIQ